MINKTVKTNTMFLSHPWHGISPGDESPEIVNVFIEIVPTDTVKYELDKQHGHLRIDRPQQFSSMCPTLYGFIPQTYCGDQIGKLCCDYTNKTGIEGDGDPLDICVLTERTINSGNILLRAKPIGGLRMIDRNQADDKIIAVLEQDALFGDLEDISQCPQGIIDRLRHYFCSYKQIPNEGKPKVEIDAVYNKAQAFEVIKTSIKDYKMSFGD
jgi:inorganic pyrophosphatase